ncbi:MAG: glycosyltransferase [Candidatus Latescibacteria bacterium]|nr:glycosyltransferase [Candidatus Latescibacterota bacterium]
MNGTEEVKDVFYRQVSEMIERMLVFVLIVVTGIYVTVALTFLTGLFRRQWRGTSGSGAGCPLGDATGRSVLRLGRVESHDYSTQMSESPTFKRGDSDQQPDVSVVLAARNEERCIADCLTDLTHQTYPPDRYEIIIVNDGSNDRTAEIVGACAREHGNVRLLQAPDPVDRGLSPKKNALDTGIREARGEIILTTDADCRIPPTWIDGIVRCFQPDVGVVIGFSQIGSPHEKSSLLERLQALDFLALMSAAAGSANVGIPLAASGQNFAYRRRVFEEVGGFTRIGRRVSGDDVLFLQVVRRQTTWRVAFAGSKETFTTTTGQKTVRGFIEQRKRWASNGIYQYQLNKPFFTYIVAVFVMNLLLLTVVPYTLIDWGLSTSHFPSSNFGFRISDFGYSPPQSSITIPQPIHFQRSLLSSLFSIQRWVTPIWCLVLKIGVDLAVILRGAILFERRDLLRVFPLWTILQIPYIVVVGITGTIGQFMWKGRRYDQSER